VNSTLLWQWLSLVTLVFASALTSAFIVWQTPLFDWMSCRILAYLIVLAALLPRALALFCAQLFEDDYFRFLWDGYQSIQSQSPYSHAPDVFLPTAHCQSHGKRF
jgi:hypothetical protein